MSEYQVGDVVEGNFSCDPSVRSRAIVGFRMSDADGRGRAGFDGASIDYHDGKGWGCWGYDDEIVEVRPATPENERAASQVKERVHFDTERYLRSLRSGRS